MDENRLERQGWPLSPQLCNINIETLKGSSRGSGRVTSVGTWRKEIRTPWVLIKHGAHIPTIFSKHSSAGHLYADDVEAFVYDPPSNQLALTGRIDALCRDLHLWMSSNRHSRTESKKEAVYLVRHSPTTFEA